MSIHKSFVLTSAFPSSKTGFEALKSAVESIEPYDFSMVEYYCGNCRADQIRSLLGKYKSVFLAAALQKEQGLNLCTPIADDRKKAINLLSECFRFARQAGAQSVLINSGKRPENEVQDKECLKYLKDSICKLHQQVNDIQILLEPGDRNVEYHHLIGHTDMAVSFIDDICTDVPNISLVFDMSHIAQLNEDLYASWEMAKKHCTHVHLANCVLDRNSSLYGDKHPLFGVKGSVYSHDTARAFYEHLQSENRPIVVGIEMICHESSEQRFFERFASETGWFFRNCEFHRPDQSSFIYIDET